MKIVFIGNEDECLGFSLCGITPVAVKDKRDFYQVTNRQFQDNEVGVIVMADRFYDLFVEHFTKRVQKSALPSVVFVPSIDKTHLKRDLKGFLANVLGIKL